METDTETIIKKKAKEMKMVSLLLFKDKLFLCN